MRTDIIKYNFSGHETFHCRGFWLKKGFDYANKPDAVFNDSAVVELGVGRNMVGSIRYWLRAFGLFDGKDQLNELAQKIFQDKGLDPYLEDEGTLWLLHYSLIRNKSRASIYHLIFGELRKIKPEFTKLHFKALALEKDNSANENTIDKDFSVFIRTYFSKPSKDIEESFSGLLTELGLLHDLGRKDELKNPVYRIENRRQLAIPKEIVLYTILDNESYGDSISFNSLFESHESPGNVFCFNKDNLETILTEIEKDFQGVVYKNDAGIKELQFKGDKPNKYKVLEKYYGQ